MSDIWAEICERLDKGQSVVAATIANEDGSTPRSAGSKMLIGADGILAGTVGGGLGEAMTIDAGKEVYATGACRLIPIDMSGEVAEGADLVCGGHLDIFIQRLEPAQRDLMRTLKKRLDQGFDSYLVNPVDGASRPSVILPNGTVEGAPLTAGQVGEILDDAPDAAGLMTIGGAVYFVEAVKAKTRLVLAGGGHVSQATAEVATLTHFQLTVMDDRAEFAAPSRFPWVDPKNLHVVPAFENCLSEDLLGFPTDERCFIAILTRGHAYDTDVLIQALGTKAGYIGMIGSRRKQKQVYAKLLMMGFTKDDLARIHNPIGLNIGAETPAEIAVSIVGEVIQCRAELAKNRTE